MADMHLAVGHAGKAEVSREIRIGVDLQNGSLLNFVSQDNSNFSNSLRPENRNGTS